MNAVDGAVRRLTRTVGRAATITTQAAGAVGGAAVNGVIGGVTGAAAGIERGLSSGSRSTPAAALTMGALGVAGLVEWPVLLAVGGAALLLRQLNQQADTPVAPAKAPSAKSAKSASSTQSSKPRRAKPTSAPRARSSQSRGRQ